MVGILGGSVMLGIDSLAPTLANVTPIENVILRNGDFDYLNAQQGLLNNLPTSIPLEWAGNTIMNTDFDSLNAGSISYAIENISKFTVERRRVDSPYQETTWTKLFEIPVDDIEDLNFTVYDFTNIHNATYIYRIVPYVIQGGQELEGTANESAEILSQFDGVFLCDRDSFVKLYAGVEYGSMNLTQITGVHPTLNNKYPIIVTNSNINYRTGNIDGVILNEDYGEFNYMTGTYNQLDRQKIVAARQNIESFLTNKKPKIIKDSNGNIWLVIFTDDVNFNFFNQWGMGLCDFSANWTEIGDATSENDLERTKLLGGVNS